MNVFPVASFRRYEFASALSLPSPFSPLRLTLFPFVSPRLQFGARHLGAKNGPYLGYTDELKPISWNSVRCDASECTLDQTFVAHVRKGAHHDVAILSLTVRARLNPRVIGVRRGPGGMVPVIAAWTHQEMDVVHKAMAAAAAAWANSLLPSPTPSRLATEPTYLQATEPTYFQATSLRGAMDTVGW